MKRWRRVVAAGGMGAAVVLAAGLPGLAADHNPADALLDHARSAVETHDFVGVVRVGWRDEAGMHWKQVTVTAVDGGLRIADGAVVSEDGRAWLRAKGAWDTLWSETRDPRAPTVGDKYHVRVSAGRDVAGRPTRVLTIRKDEQVVQRIAVDRSDGFVVRRVRYDDDGRANAVMEFVSLSDVRTRRGGDNMPDVGVGAPRKQAAPPGTRERVGDGFVLVGSHRVGAETQLQYTDGVFDASVFVRDGALDWNSLPPGGTDVELASVRVRRYRTSVGTVLAFEAGGRTLTGVTDAPDSEQRRIVASLSDDDDEDDDGLTEVVRFVTRPFSWV